MRQREGSKAGRVCVCVCVSRLQLAKGFPEPTASVVELLNNFTGLSERSFKVATWPGQHSRARAAGFTQAPRKHTHTHRRTQAFHGHTQAQTRLNPPAADRDKSVQSDKSASMCVCVCAGRGLTKKNGK